MKLDLNCIRDTLFVLEENLVLNDDLDFRTLDVHEICEFPQMKAYSLSEVEYSVASEPLNPLQRAIHSE